jgi:periplasmic protein CpxP/Spy
MKLSKTTWLAALVIGGLVAFAPFTQAAKGAKNAKNANASSTVQDNAKARLATLTKKLDLTSDQQIKVKAILKDEATKIKELKSVKQQTARQRNQKLKSIQQETDTKIKEVLTPDQLAKWPAPTGKGGAKNNKATGKAGKKAKTGV